MALATPPISTLSLHDALPILRRARGGREPAHPREGRAPGAGTTGAGADGSGGGAVGGGTGAAAGAGRRRGGCRAGAWVSRVFGGVSDDDADSRSGGRIRHLL